MLDTKRHLFKNIERKAGKILSSLPFHPNHYTILSVAVAALGLILISNSKIIEGFFIFILASILDFMDGAVARYKNLSTKQGAYLDTICDRYVEGMLLFSFTTLTLSTIIFESYIWIFLIFFGSLMTTYSKAAAKEKELTQTELKGGLFSRGERLICLLFALIIYTYNPLVTLYILIITAILSNITALQRIVKALKNS